MPMVLRRLALGYPCPVIFRAYSTSTDIRRCSLAYRQSCGIRHLGALYGCLDSIHSRCLLPEQDRCRYIGQATATRMECLKPTPGWVYGQTGAAQSPRNRFLWIKPWIPAFAGMTVEKKVRLYLVHPAPQKVMRLLTEPKWSNNFMLMLYISTPLALSFRI